MLLGLVSTEMEVGIKFLEILQDEFEPAYKHLHDTNFLQCSRRVLRWCDDVYLWWFNCTWDTLLFDV